MFFAFMAPDSWSPACYGYRSTLIFCVTPDLPAAAFKPTRWSLVLQLQGRGDDAHQALEHLCQAYWFPLYSWSRRYGVSAEDSEDYVQSFFVQVLNKQLFAAADPALGKLRTFLLTAFRRHVGDEQRKAGRQRRGGGKIISFDANEAEAWYEVEQIEGESADHMFDRQWALTVLDQALAKLEAQAAVRGKADEFAQLRPFLTGDADASHYEAAGTALALSASSTKVAVHRLRAKFREALRAEVRDTQPEGASEEEELSYLMQVLRDV